MVVEEHEGRLERLECLVHVLGVHRPSPGLSNGVPADIVPTMLGMDCLVALRLVLLAAGFLIIVPLGIVVAVSVLDNLGMLVGAFGWWGIAIFLVIPTLIVLFGRDDRPDRR